ncbi:hypothetical protein BCR34DRAFT_585441 [Clohesyomyces aquaticus]|uniref:Uncharacterized protein n=1 Tax=Clohesyomyces aquaticus TaxID=1231657 RepID=A0A1Y1ZXU0_9PLEO|nr:hypothetical protein BCR34DRAFT_585441 [Clohesyomyces aquaticus]
MRHPPDYKTRPLSPSLNTSSPLNTHPPACHPPMFSRHTRAKKPHKGTVSEYLNLPKKPTPDVIDFAFNPEDGTEPTPNGKTPAGRLYMRQLLTNSELREKAKKFVEEIWWDELCRTADREKFYGVLFQKEWFEKEKGREGGGTAMDIRNPVFKKLVTSLCIIYMHITTRWGEDALTGWKVRWAGLPHGAPFLNCGNPTPGDVFGMTPPKSGYLDSRDRLKALRSKRDAEENARIPHWSKIKIAKIVTREDKGPGESPASLNSSPSTATAQNSKVPLADDVEEEDVWGLITEDNTSLYDSADNADDNDYTNVRLNTEKNGGYQYKIWDAKQARKNLF